MRDERHFILRDDSDQKAQSTDSVLALAYERKERHVQAANGNRFPAHYADPSNHFYALLTEEVIQMPKRDSKGPPTGVKGPHDGRGKGKGRAPGKGVGNARAVRKAPASKAVRPARFQPFQRITKG